MKALLLPLALYCGISAVHAQLLPVPGAKNPDWKVETPEVVPEAVPFGEAPKTDRMPNAVQKSIASKGNLHHYWDAERQLTYEWRSRPGSGTVAPDKKVVVREDRTGLTYTFIRRR
ncbi:hypothetical protein [Hymenobacter properus]|uniref:Uncharacterized protein n=1 Tax=Hymenobacter properus TaxID=2791026 RepID=A0A931BLK6_9BACT|nr:hypothetical protein [Hymenobacter properus]MBF9143606.1 hypothetical protein [Hymenobacter properus]MBR7722419.1 hypothetical protein [Microvirga sp. SRT04]